MVGWCDRCEHLDRCVFVMRSTETTIILTCVPICSAGICHSLAYGSTNNALLRVDAFCHCDPTYSDKEQAPIKIAKVRKIETP